MPNRDSCFKDLVIHDPVAAFENAIKRGLKNPEDYMYMYSEGKWDYFKHCVTRAYIKFRNNNNHKRRDNEDGRCKDNY